MIDIEKVKEAIESIKKIDIYVDGSFWNYKDTDYKNDVIVIEHVINELERLQQKEIPMKVLYFTQERGFRIEMCPKCKSSIQFLKHGHEIHNRGNYCDICGQHLDWSDNK